MNRTTLLIATLSPALIAYNVWRFATAEARPDISTHLHFLPDPHLAAALDCGHHNTMAKLRWIDSFTYMNKQVTTKNDDVAGDGRGTFERLYDFLITLDPQFGYYYLHAVLSCAGIMDDNHVALRFLALGTLHLPTSPAIWANYAAHLKAFFHLEERHTEQMEAILQQWAAAVGPGANAVPHKWLAALGMRQQRGDAQVDYWLALLASVPPDSNEDLLIQDLLRQQIAYWHCQVLATASDLPKHVPLTGLALSIDELPPAALSAYGPIDATDHIKPDPYGGAYFRMDDGRIVSQGMIARALQHQIDHGKNDVEAKASAYPALGFSISEGQITFPNEQKKWALR